MRINLIFVKGVEPMIKKAIGVIVSFILLFSIIAGCSSSGKKSDTASSVSPAAGGDSGYVASSQAGADFSSSPNSVKYYDDEQKFSYSASNVNANNVSTVREDVKKIIKNGTISVEVKDVDAAYEGIMKIVHELGGEEFNKNYSISGEYKHMQLVLKIPPENLNLFQDRITEYVGKGKIRNINIVSTDITSEYYDYSARLESYKASRDQMLELLKKAQNIDEILKIQAEITRLQAEIDSLQGQIRMWDKLIAMTTITLYIDQEDNPFKTTTEVSWKFSSFEEIWSTMRNGFINVVNTLYSLIIWLVVGIVSLSPVIIIAGIVLYVVLRIKRKRSKKQT